MLNKLILSSSLILASLAATAGARDPQRWVSPPAPQVIEGKRIVPVAEVFDGQRYILHLPKPEQLDWRQTRYVVEIERNDGQLFYATLATRPFVKDDEVVFLTIPDGSAGKFSIEVIDKSSYPYQRVWSGSLDSIKVMAK